MTEQIRFQIESGIPLPTKFPFAQMQVGDSFLIPPDTQRTAVDAAARRYGNKRGMKFTVRSTPHGFRCWRVV